MDVCTDCKIKEILSKYNLDETGYSHICKYCFVFGTRSFQIFLPLKLPIICNQFYRVEYYNFKNYPTAIKEL